MSEDKSKSLSDGSGSGSQHGSNESQNRVRRKKKKKKSKTGISPELSSRLVTVVLILLGALFIFSLYYIVVNINVKTP